MARKGYDTGISMCRPMYYEFPENENAYTFKEQYYFGDNILAATVCEPIDSLSGKAGRQVRNYGRHEYERTDITADCGSDRGDTASVHAVRRRNIRNG